MVPAARRWLRTSLPKGDALPDDVFARRHEWLRWVMVLHAPALFAFGVVQGFYLPHLAIEVAPLVVLALADRRARRSDWQAFWVSTGLMWSSAVLVHLSGGMIEAHFHFFVVLGLIALYQQWIPFAWAFVFTVFSHGLGSALGPTVVFNHPAAIARPWLWAGIHALAVLLASTAQVVFWRAAEEEQQRVAELSAGLADETAASARREATSALVVNLARRNQSLLTRQLELIERLEHATEVPEELRQLFALDHLATRMRRNAESLMVLAGHDAGRVQRDPLPLSRVVRGAIAEVEDYARPRVSLQTDPQVDGRVAPSLAHLLAELIENAITYSPPDTPVVVKGRTAPDGYAVEVVDAGIGIDQDSAAELNRRVAGVDEIDLERVRSLGLHVVGRLAAKHGLSVRLGAGAHGGTTVTVRVPDEHLVGWGDAVLVPTAALRSLGQVGTPDAPAAATAPRATAPAPARPQPATPPTAAPAPAMAAETTGTTPLWDDDVPLPSPETTTPGGLPRRTPSAQLHEGLRRPAEAAAAAPPGPLTGPTAPTRDAAATGTSLSALQSRSRVGRAEVARLLAEAQTDPDS